MIAMSVTESPSSGNGGGGGGLANYCQGIFHINDNRINYTDILRFEY